MKRLLLGSGGLRTPERVEAWQSSVDKFLGEIDTILFIPFAIADHDGYTQALTKMDLHHGRRLMGIHTVDNMLQALTDAQAIHVGGGNTFRLLHALRYFRLLDPLRQRVLGGLPYLGISAGSNVACPTIQTTNDMPIVDPKGLKALNLIPFQINAHYFAGPLHYANSQGQLIPYGGETRDDRIREFHEMNDLPVLGLSEGSILRVHEDELWLTGIGNATLFIKGKPPVLCKPGKLTVN